MNPRTLILVGAITLLAGLGQIVVSDASAATNSTFITTGTGAASWNVGSNWNTNPIVPGSAGNNNDTATFSALAGGLSPLTLDTTITVKGITNTTGNRGTFLTNGTGGSLVFATTDGSTPFINLSPSVNSTVLFQFGTAAAAGPPAVPAGALTTDISQGLNITVTGTGVGANAASGATASVRIQAAATFVGTGTITMNNGILAPQAANVLPQKSDIVLNNAQIALLGATNGLQNVRGLDGNAGSSVSNFTNASTAVLTLGNANALSTDAFTFSGVIGANTAAATPAAGANLSVVKAGAGTQTLGGANIYSGTTTVNAGTLLATGVGVAGTSSATGLGAVTVNNSGTLLGGTGAIQGAVTVNGAAKITGGTDTTIGTLTLRSTATLTGTSSNLAGYLVNVGAGANNSDRLTITGALVLNTAFDQISFTGTVDGTSSYVLATYASHDGIFDSTVNLPSGYQLVYGATELDLTPTAVPEPATIFAGVLLIGAFGWRGRRMLVA